MATQVLHSLDVHQCLDSPVTAVAAGSPCQGLAKKVRLFHLCVAVSTSEKNPALIAAGCCAGMLAAVILALAMSQTGKRDREA